MANETQNAPSEPGTMNKVLAPMRALVEQTKQIYIERHDYRDATDADFADRDRAGYDRAGGELVLLGYRPLGDVVNETVRKAAISL